MKITSTKFATGSFGIHGAQGGLITVWFCGKRKAELDNPHLAPCHCKPCTHASRAEARECAARKV